MHGWLFTTDFLHEGIRQTPGWLASESEFIGFRAAIQQILSRVAHASGWNEAQTEDEIIGPVLVALGWSGCSLGSKPPIWRVVKTYRTSCCFVPPKAKTRQWQNASRIVDTATE